MDKPTVQDIFHRFYPAYLAHYSPSPVQANVAHHIMNCKTGAYGANVCVCEDCGFVPVSYTHLDVYKRQLYILCWFTSLKHSSQEIDIFLLNSGICCFITYQNIPLIDYNYKFIVRHTVNNR